MRANPQPRVNADQSLIRELREHATLINLMSDGRISGTNNAATTAPDSGVHAWGDFVRNREPVEAGDPGSAYVVFGWLCVAGGDPGTWVECRFHTGN
jgi:hypothetical protein